MTDAPDWLAAMQRRFGDVLRAPLDRATGTLRATTEAYDPDALADVLDAHNADARGRLAVYNRQYWFRLFGVMQTAFPVTTKLLGAWHFNEHAARFLLAHPPHSWDLDHAPDGFESFLATTLGERPDREVLLDAATLDAAWRALFRAPAVAPFQPTAQDAARLLDAHLEPSPAVALVVERYALLELRATLAQHRGEAPVPTPAALPQPRGWALVREATGVRHVPLEPREGELLRLLREHTVREALGRLEAECPEAERAGLPASTQRWLARSVAGGFWVGLRA